ncbi:BamA/TamA family outer membrane protein [Candidatus Babeliales bacterium]|nr:BamA/TamA family outer membrane protein [Candidatus Babeliales bacterium]MBP9844172.1 BamA/TamA family outer membrane protein [Candidatus Babeliales bacterium]
MQFLLFLFFTAFQSSWICGQEIIVDCTHNSSGLKTSLPTKIFVKSIDIQADFKVDQDELLYLIDLVPMSHISVADLEQTVFYLRKKEYFSKIELFYYPVDHRLIFKLEGLFVLSSFRLHGSMIGKEKYKSAYIMETGECFEEKKHQYSLKKIKEKFYQDGCFKAEVEDEVIYDPILKTVKVDLFLHKGHQFTVGNCKFDIASIDKVSQQDLLLINQQLHKLFIKRFFKLKYTKELVEKAIAQLKHFLTKKGFSQSQVTYDLMIDYDHHQVDLNFNLSFDEKKEFVFWGNHFFTQENFLENISMYGKSSWHFPGAILADEIESMYKSKGFWDVKVSVKEEENKTFCVIHEGKRALLQDVEIKDNFHIPSKKLQSECFGSLHNLPFDRDAFSQAISMLKQMYMQHGFWDIKIVKEEFIPFYPQAENYKTVDYKAFLTLDEGVMRKLKSVEIEGYPELLLEKPFVQLSGLKDAIPFNYSWISTQKNWLITHFKDLGHTKVIVEYEFVSTEDGIILVWKIHLDEKQVHFGRFVVTGNSQIPFKYLKRELNIEQGQIWDKKKIEDSMANLRNLELFDTVHVFSHKETDDLGHIPVGVKLIAADKYEVRTRIGAQQVGKDFSLQQGFSYKAGGTLILNNPFKFGDRVVVEADFTRFYENFSMQYLMPWLFAHRRIRSQLKIYDNHYLQPLYIGSDVSIYNAAQQGVLFGLQEKYENINVGMSVGIEFKGVSIADIDDIGISIDYKPSFFGKKIAFLFAEPSLMWTNVDNVVNPRSGSNALITLLAMADIVDQTSLFKFLGEYALYIPFTPQVVFAIRTRIGHIFNQQYNEILPIDRFYLGGANTLRGYDRDYCPPLGRLTKPIYAPSSGLPLEAKNLWHYVNQGGRTMFNCNFETRFPIYYQLEGAVFFDAGVLIKDSVQDVPENMLGGLGFGFRYNTPIGPLRFDISFKLDRKYPEFEPPYVWYLTLGQAF